MNETLLQYLWQYKILNSLIFKTPQNQKIEVIHPGFLNQDAGPDFFNAKVKIDDTLWVGNIEIHLKSSQWKQHKHHLDPAYNNVILHVVLNNDSPTINAEHQEIPTIEVTVPTYIQNHIQLLENETRWLKCGYAFQNIDAFTILEVKERLAAERLEYKSLLISDLLQANCNNWEQTCYELMARSFGFNINSEPMKQLAAHITLSILQHYTDDYESFEALLFGTAGFLDEMINEDDYHQKLSMQYRHLQHKHQLKPLNKHVWKFAKTRPSNFPTIRISQFAMLYFRSPQLFAKIIAATDLKQLRQILQQVSSSSYWETHYQFNHPSKQKPKRMGASAIDGILINSIIPLIFTYGKSKANHSFCERALVFLEELKPENNQKVNGWKMFNVEAANAKESQALLHLRINYCELNKCLQCKIGHKILTTSNG